MYDYLIPLSPDGGGNHYCFDTRIINNNSCNVVFWQHDYAYTVDDAPEVTNPSFTEWIKQVVNNTYPYPQAVTQSNLLKGLVTGTAVKNRRTISGNKTRSKCK